MTLVLCCQLVLLVWFVQYLAGRLSRPGHGTLIHPIRKDVATCHEHCSREEVAGNCCWWSVVGWSRVVYTETTPVMTVGGRL